MKFDANYTKSVRHLFLRVATITLLTALATAQTSAGSSDTGNSQEKEASASGAKTTQTQQAGQNTQAANAGEQAKSEKEAIPMVVTTITVYGWREAVNAPIALLPDSITDPASVSVITQEDLSNQIKTTPGDILRATTGVQVDNYGQPGEAQGITMRGWSNGYDGGFVAYFQDGFQRNEPSNISVDGYLDINPLIPETVEQVTVVRGPSDVRYGGNFAQAGSVVVTTRDYIPTGFVVDFGTNDMARLLGTIGYKRGNTSIYQVVDGSTNDGYRRNSNQKALKTFTKFETDIAGHPLKLGFETYNNTFRLPSYIDVGDIEAGLISPRSFVDATDHGSASAYALTANYSRGDYNKGVGFTGYVAHDYFNRYVTTIPFPQFYRDDGRWVAGGSVDPYFKFHLFGMDALAIAGASVQHHAVNVNEFPSVNGVVDRSLIPSESYFYHQTQFSQTNIGLYGSLAIHPISRVKVSAGFRYDYFDYPGVTDYTFDTTSMDIVHQHFSAGMGKVSPKIAVAVQLTKSLTAFGNYGVSPHSASAWSQLPANHNLAASYLRNGEVGLSLDAVDGRYHFQAMAYNTLNKNEIGEVGYQVINFGESTRDGYDLEAAAGLLHSEGKEAKLTANFCHVDTKLTTVGGYVPYVAKWLASYGFLVAHPVPYGPLSFNMTHEFIGPQKLENSGIFVSKTFNRLTGRLSYKLPKNNNLTVWLGTVYYPGDRYSEFSFELYNKIYSSPVPRVQVQFGITIPLSKGGGQS